MNSGLIDKIYTEEVFMIMIGGDDWDEQFGKPYSDYERAFKDYNSIDYRDFPGRENYSSNTKRLEKVQIIYEFIGEIDPEFEKIEDYIDQRTLKDESYWKITNEPEPITILNDSIERVNKESDSILQEVTRYFGGKYSTINIDESDDPKTLKLRIADHSGKHKNKGLEDYFLSIVITNANPTEHFYTSGPEGLRRSEEEIFDSGTSANEIIGFINEQIRQMKEENSSDNNSEEINESETVRLITEKVKEQCKANKYKHLCQRIESGDNGLAYVVNRCIKSMSEDKIKLSTALAYLESEFEGIN